jgi:hypothetical protein
VPSVVMPQRPSRRMPVALRWWGPSYNLCLYEKII